MPIKRSIGENPYFGSNGRKNVFKLLLFAVASVFLVRLAQLQLLEGSEHKIESEAQAIRKVKVEPFRGNMYDRNGKLIVHNEASFSVTLTPKNFDNLALPLLCSLLETDSASIFKTVKKYSKYSHFEPVKIHRDASFEIISRIEEYLDYLPGIGIAVESKRLYEFDCNMAHLLGYTGEVSQRQLDKRPYLNPGDLIGKAGLEASYENFLKGMNGYKFVAVNKWGRPVASFEEGKNDIPAINGKDLQLTIDIDLQIKAEELLEGKRGAVVALDPNTGELIVMASKPDFDPRDFSGRIPAKLYDSLRLHEGKPLLPRAFQSAYAPGSTWKMLMLAAALQEGIIDEHTTFNCNGGMYFGNRHFGCTHVHGSVDARRAIQGSCNTYFYHLGLKLGLDKIYEYGKLFGFGDKTGLDVPYEGKGSFPSSKKLMKKNNYIPKGIVLNWGIGQGEISTTPLQVAAYTAALANGGTLIQPHTVSHIYDPESQKLEPVNYTATKLPIKDTIFDIIHDGMFDVVNKAGGTATNVRIDSLDICGKTGTAQNPHGRDHSWFICFAPKDNPKIAVACMVENAGYGSTVAAPIAKEIVKGFFYPDTTKARQPDSLSIQSQIDSLKLEHEITANQ